MKYKLKRKLKKIGTFFLALLTLFSSLFGGMAGMPAPVVNVAAKEGTATVKPAGKGRTMEDHCKWKRNLLPKFRKIHV